MSFDDNERKERECFGIYFHGTAEQCTEVSRRKDLIQCYRRWSVVDYLVKCGRFSAFDPRAVALCEELADLDFRVKEALRIIVASVTADIPDGI